MFFSKKPKYTVVLARGYNGVEQVTVSIDTDNLYEIADAVDTAAAAVQSRTDYYVAEQKKLEEANMAKLKKVEAEEAKLEAQQTNKNKKDK